MEITDDTNSSDVSNITADVPEHLPNNAEEAFVDSPQTPEPCSEAKASVNIDLPNVLVSTSAGLFTNVQLQNAIRTTRLLIHDQSVNNIITSEISPPLPTTPKKTKFNWDPTVFDPVLPVRCKDISGSLHKQRLGSGGRGRCIKVNQDWYTPSEFETLSGRANSKDWKRSIRYAGRTLQCLIDDGILQPHAAACTCSACCDDETVSGPVRLFTPYKRRKKDDIGSEGDEDNADILEKTMVVSVTSASGQESSQVVTTSSGLDTILAGASFVTLDGEPLTTGSRQSASSSDLTEQRNWWQLEEMVKNLARQVQELQKQVECVKAQSSETRELRLQQLKIQMENEKKEALNTSRIEAQMNLSRAILEARSEKEIAVQEALQQARAEMHSKIGNLMENSDNDDKRCANCNREAFCECTGCRSVSYCSAFCQRKDWENHRRGCGSDILESSTC